MKIIGRTKRSLENNNLAGFSLLETMIIVVIFSLFLTAFLRFAKTDDIYQKSWNELNQTTIIAKALDDYVQKYGFYPLPADPAIPITDTTVFQSVSGNKSSTSKLPADTTCNSVAVTAGTNGSTSAGGAGASDYAGKAWAGVRCRSIISATTDKNYWFYMGVVPVTTLGLPKEAGLDKWGHKFSYFVTYNQTDPSTFNPQIGANVAAGAGNLFVENAVCQDDVKKTCVNIASYLNYVVIGHGANGNGAFDYKGNLIGTCNDVTREKYNCINRPAAIPGKGLGYFRVATPAANPGKYASIEISATNAVDRFDDKFAFSDSIGSSTLWAARDEGDVYFAKNGMVRIGNASSTAGPTATLQIFSNAATTGNMKAEKVISPAFCNTTGLVVQSASSSAAKCLTLSDINVSPSNSAKYYCGSNKAMYSIVDTGTSRVTCEAIAKFLPITSEYDPIKACPEGIKGYNSSGEAMCF